MTRNVQSRTGSWARRSADWPAWWTTSRLAADALAELVACFPVYRSYLPEGADHLRAALADAVRRRPDLADTLALLGERASAVGTEFSRRFQQTTGAVMAKGVEDCAFYRWTRASPR